MSKSNTPKNKYKKREDIELKKFVSAVDQTNDAVFITNINGYIEYVNPAFEKMTGFKRSEAIGKTPRIIKSGEHDPIFYEKLWSTILSGKAFRQTLVNKTKKGKHFVVDHSITPIKNKQGQITNFIGIWKDITKRKEREDAEREDLVRFTNLFEQSPLSVQIFSPDGETIGVNKAWEKLWNIPFSKLGKYNILKDKQLISSGSMTYIKKAFAGEAVEIPVIRYEPAKTKKIKGLVEYVWTKAYAYPIKNNKDEIKEVVIIHQDVTEKEETERKKEEFVSMASHELKTPLTSINIYLKLLQKSLAVDNKQTADTCLENMLKQVERLNKLTNELLNVSILSSDGLQIKGKHFSLEKLIKENVKKMNGLSKGSNVTIKGKLQKNVWGDPDYINQVITNLLANAIKYSSKDYDIEVKLTSKTDAAMVSVKDRGFGIAKEHHEKIFNRFYRVYDKIDRTYPGLGMGLYISREIIKRHGGNMWLKSKSGKGSTFYFSLPYSSIRIN